MKINSFSFAYILVAIYGFIFSVFRPDGISIFKIAITVLPWVSILMGGYFFIKNNKKLKRDFGTSVFVLFCCILLINVLSILRSLIFYDVSLIKNFGNSYNALAMMAPLFFCYGSFYENLRLYISISFRMMMFGLLAFLVLVLIGVQQKVIAAAVMSLLIPSLFIMGFYLGGKKHSHVVRLISVGILLFYVGLVFESRAMLVRIAVLAGCVKIAQSKKIKSLFHLLIYCCIIVVPILTVFFSVTSGESALRVLSQEVQGARVVAGSEKNSLLVTDTRTFLYEEVYRDLNERGQLLWGKGSGGVYYSEYFNETKEDTDTRLTVEVGILAIFLKTGILGVFLNYLLVNIAAYLAIFRSNNIYSKWIGYFILIHGLILFVENFVAMDVYNLSAWFFSGLCASKNFRAKSDAQILNLVSNKHAYSGA